MKANRSISISAVFAAAIAGYVAYQWWDNPARAVQRRLGEVAAALSAPDHEPDAARIARLAQLRRYLAADVRVRAGSSGPEITSRDVLLGLVAGSTAPPGGRNVRFADVQVTLESDARARAYMTVELSARDSQTGQATVDAREANIGLEKREDSWIITNAEQIETLH